MPFCKIWIHLIWTTKNHKSYLQKEIRPKIFSHIRENASKKSIHLDFINGYREHVHTLISLKSDQTIAKVAQMIKGESSFWINKNNLTNFQFAWQEEYIALSISDSMVNRVRNYIKKQESHHRIKTFAEEYNEFIKKYGFFLDK
jgi:REP element-mobilizing transposase RayT